MLIGMAAGVYFFFPGVTLALAERAELHAAGLERASVEVAGHRIVYLVGGSGEPLLLLHGFGADKSNWVRVARYLTPRFRVIAPDLPGFGESTWDSKAHYAVSDQADRVHAFAQALGFGPLHVGGNSMGGSIAGVYAARYRQEVKSVWLLAPGGVRSAKPSQLQERIGKGDNPLFVRDTEGFERLLDFAFVQRPLIPRPIERYLAERAIAHRAINEKIGEDLQHAPVVLENELAGLPIPALIVWGDHDRLVDVSGAEVLKGVMPKAEVVILRDVGHVPMVERPDASARAFLHFQKIES